jgi:hypothetical protein
MFLGPFRSRVVALPSTSPTHPCDEQRGYSVSDRMSPRVVRMLGRCDRYKFGGWEMGKEVEDVTVADCGYWLERMDLFLRPRE